MASGPALRSTKEEEMTKENRVEMGGEKRGETFRWAKERVGNSSGEYYSYL